MSLRLPLVDESALAYEHPLYTTLLAVPGLSVLSAPLDSLLAWGTKNALWVFPMATSCCGIELMAAAASRVDLDRMGTIVRATPRQGDVMVIAGTITVKMAPRVKLLWDQMPEPKWAVAMGSCAISGDFYRDLYPVVPGVDTFMPVEVYIPGCPPNPEQLMNGLLRLQEKLTLRREGKVPPPDRRPESLALTMPRIGRIGDETRDPGLSQAQLEDTRTLTSRDLAVPPGDVPSPEPPDAAPSHTARPDHDLSALLEAEFAGVTAQKNVAPEVAPSDHRRLARRLRDLGYVQFVYIVATHFPAKKADSEHFEVACALRSVGRGSRLAAWRVTLAPGKELDSLVDLFAGADWQEREQFDLVGVRFTGHPDMRRLMMPADWTGHPLRKDYAADTAHAPWR